MSNENDLAENNDQVSLNPEAVQESPELQEPKTEETPESKDGIENAEVDNEPKDVIADEEVTAEVDSIAEVSEASEEVVGQGSEDASKEVEEPTVATEEETVVEVATDETPTSETKESDTEATTAIVDSVDGNVDTEEEHDEEEIEEEIDYLSLSKQELLQAVSDISADFTLKKAGIALNEIREAHAGIFQSERDEALAKFTEDGGEETDFEFKGDEDDAKIEEYFKLIREKRSQHYNQLEKQKDANLKVKEELLEKLRDLVHGEENTASIEALKALQEQWRNAGPVHQQHNKTLWANYHALINQYYDQRSIYFELKELDRKKNMESKLEICKKAEELNELENFNDAVKKLNDLHEEYKHVGPVPRDHQEELWQRFKKASDVIYAKRKEYVSSLKDALQKNLEQKVVIAEKVSEFVNFTSDRITDWNQKTKELLAIQKEWEAVGSMPKEKAKEINKKFWGEFKTFFQHKSEFFKSLESKREENLKLKEDLVAKANELKVSDDWEGTANALKRLQQDWKEIGPVPEKDREPVYQAFKAACDGFFNRRREHNKGVESSYEVNLKKKEEVCDKLEAIAKSKAVVPDDVYALQDEYGEIGFVPKKAIRSIQKRYQSAIDAVLKSADNLDEETRNELSSLVRLHNLKSGPNSGQKISRQEHALKRKITNLENDISTWKNNMGFFANSKNADNLMKDFQKKIEDSEDKLKSLKEELKLLSTME